MGLRSEEGVRCVEVGSVLQRVVGAVADCDRRKDEGYDTEHGVRRVSAAEVLGSRTGLVTRDDLIHWHPTRRRESRLYARSTMDYDRWLKSSQSYIYVDTPNSNLLCCICRSVPSPGFYTNPPHSFTIFLRMPFVEPTTSRTCAHSFCRDCIYSALQTSPHCPIDRSPLSPRDMAASNPVVRHVRTRSIYPLGHS